MPQQNSQRQVCKKKSGNGKKQVRFSGIEICVSPSTMSVSTTETVNSEAPPTNLEDKPVDVSPSTMSVSTTETVNSEAPLTNLADKPVASESKILSYLMKLVDYLRSAPSKATGTSQQVNCTRENANDSFQRLNADDRKDRVNKNVMKPVTPEPDKYTPKINQALNKRDIITNPKMPSNEPSCSSTCTRAPKAYEIVCAAIEYGVANGIVLRKGDWFRISEDISRNRRSLTPGCASQACLENKDESKTDSCQETPLNTDSPPPAQQDMKSYHVDPENNTKKSMSNIKSLEQPKRRKTTETIPVPKRKRCESSRYYRSRSRSRPRSLRDNSDRSATSSVSLSPPPPKKKLKYKHKRGKR